MVLDEIFCSTQPTTTVMSNNTLNTNGMKMSNIHDKSNRTSMDIFNESIGEIIRERGSDEKSTRTTIIDDIHNYRNYVTSFNLKHKPDIASSSLFWQTYGTNFSILNSLAKIMLSSTATSVPSESCFSVSSFLGRKERCRLTGDNLSASVFLKDKID